MKPTYMNIKFAPKKFKGFTLIELLVVIAILGILAAAVLVAINPAKRQRQAQDAKRKNDIGALATELQGYYTSPGSGCYPTSLGVLTAENYLKQLPQQPVTNAGYDYATSAVGTCVPAGPTEVAVYATLAEPTSTAAGANEVWCFQSRTGIASEATANSVCTP